MLKGGVSVEENAQKTGVFFSMALFIKYLQKK
jgi:hypothetical protein